MGYVVTLGATKADIVRQLIAQYLPRDSELCNDSLWAVVEGLDAELTEQLVIACFRLQQFHEGWGYKQIDECMRPFYYDCPLRMLELAPVACEDWRTKVRAFHAR